MSVPRARRRRGGPRFVEIVPRVDSRADKMAETVARRLVHDVIMRGLQPGENHGGTRAENRCGA
jgi:hypothetical protein